MVDVADASLYGEEQFGPISFVVATADTREAIDKAVQLARSKGAITGSVYSTNQAVLDEAADKFAAAGVNLSCNLTGGSLRQPECGIQRLSRQRRQSGRQCVPDGCGLRRQPFPCDRHQEAGRRVKKSA